MIVEELIFLARCADLQLRVLPDGGLLVIDPRVGHVGERLFIAGSLYKHERSVVMALLRESATREESAELVAKIELRRIAKKARAM